MSRIRLREAAAMRLVIEQRAPETFERAALRWPAWPCHHARAVALEDCLRGPLRLLSLEAIAAIIAAIAALKGRLPGIKGTGPVLGPVNPAPAGL